LEANAAGELGTLMLLVVTSGSGPALISALGAPVYDEMMTLI
jgi:hypothetical protein